MRYLFAFSFLWPISPTVKLRPVSYTNDPRVIAQNNRHVAINTFLQIDLFGQPNPEALGSRQYSGIGGGLDFSRGP